MDERIGKYGEGSFKPKATITGGAMPKQILITRSLGGGYYAVVPPGVIPDLEELIDELKGEIDGKSKRKKHIAAPVGKTDSTV